jgi:hypothetical protein
MNAAVATSQSMGRSDGKEDWGMSLAGTGDAMQFSHRILGRSGERPTPPLARWRDFSVTGEITASYSIGTESSPRGD